MTPLERIRLYNDPMLNSHQVADVLGIKRKTLHRRNAYGSRLAPQPTIRQLGVGNYWDRDALEQWLTINQLWTPFTKEPLHRP